MFRKRKSRAIQRARQYAVGNDFCSIFDNQADRLYLLAFLLTADQKKAEECVVTGLEDCLEGNPVFRDWARAWSIRTIVKRAIGMMRPLAKESSSTPTSSELEAGSSVAEIIATITHMPIFERFVFVLSVLEGYTDRDCAGLLNCPTAAIVTARIRALEYLKPAETISRPESAVYEFQPILAHADAAEAC